jgi:hypothetical protein
MSTPDLRTGMTGVNLIPVVGGCPISQRVGVVLPPCDAALEACSSTEEKLLTAAMHTCGREEACSTTGEKLFTASMHTCGREVPPVCPTKLMFGSPWGVRLAPTNVESTACLICSDLRFARVINGSAGLPRSSLRGKG